MLPANEARADLNSVRGTAGLVGGMKPVRPRFGAPVGPPRPQAPVSGIAPAGVPTTQTAPVSQATASPHVLTKTASGAAKPWMAPGGAGDAPPTGTPPQMMTAAPGSPTPISTFGPGNDLLSSQINPGNSGVNRTQIAQNTLASYDAQDAPRLAGEMRAVGQNAAKFGRIGAGMTTNDLTGIEATHARDRGSLAASLASGLADSTVNDARANNDELRTERSYQTGRSDKAQQDQINQKILEDQLLNSRFGRAKTLTDTGYGSDPSSLLSGMGQDAGNQAASSVSGGISLLKNRQQPTGSTDYTALLQQLLKQQSGG